MLITADSRTVLRDALRQRLGGQPATDIDEVLPSPSGLTQIEKSAWVLLQNWSRDEPLRQDFASHAEYSRKRLQHFLDQLQ